MAHSYKSAIGFGLVYIPITLHNTIKNNDIGFNMLDKKTKSRVQYKKTCVDCNDRIVKNDDIIKGYEIDKDTYITFTNEELEKLKSKKDKNIMIEEFVDLSEINPIYFDKTYYVSPEKKESTKAYYLLKTVLKEEKKVGIAKTMLGSTECVVALWVKDDDLLISRLFFHDEVQANPAANIQEKVTAKELNLAKNIIDSMLGKFQPEVYKDEYNERLRKAIEDKSQGKTIRKVDRDKPIKIISLMDALEASLKNSKKPKKKASSTATKLKKAQ